MTRLRVQKIDYIVLDPGISIYFYNWKHTMDKQLVIVKLPNHILYAYRDNKKEDIETLTYKKLPIKKFIELWLKVKNDYELESYTKVPKID